MGDQPLSRFAGMDPKPQPQHTVVVPSRDATAAILSLLLDKREVFTVEPSPTQPEVWHLGVFDTALPAITQAFAGHIDEVGG
jgi:hypothetical protein